MRVRRILVALDASAQSLAALEAAAEMAARMEAELAGLFVEDINLLRLAGLPFAHEVGLFSALRRPLDSPAMERMLRTVEEQSRQAIASVAERRRVRWSFRVARGPVAAELLAAALNADLLALGRTSQRPGRTSRLGSTALKVLAGAPGAVMLLQQGISAGGPALVVFDGAQSSMRSLARAAELAKTCADELIVVALTKPRQAGGKLRKVAARYRLVFVADVGRLIDLVRKERAAAIVLAGSNRFLSETALQQLIEQIECPIFFVRE
jgi:nucleotide-binding universal stress UspA family protein